jgi:anthranilate synthase component 1
MLEMKVKIEKVESTDDQFVIFQKLFHNYDSTFILESLSGPKVLSEVSIIGFDPDLTISCDSNHIRIRKRSGVEKVREVVDPLSQLREFVPSVSDHRFRFLGGAVGYISYDAIRFWERLRKRKNLKSDFPLLEFGVYTDGILYDHLKRQPYYFSLDSKSRLDEVRKILMNASVRPSQGTFSTTIPKQNLSREEFVEMVEKAKRYLYDGDIFQVVLSKRTTFKTSGNLMEVYANLRRINPSPYMYFFKIRNRAIIGSSPEMLLRVTGNVVETFPIAGTRPITKDRNQNERLKQDLLSDEKEIAEHTMLVDLARNDIGKVSEFGTVKVKELMKINSFSHVQHLISHVTGILRPDNDSFDAFKAVFPAGTVSGAPKPRAMQIIEELETQDRGPYAGALGYFSANGSCDFAIAIRTIFVNGNTAFVQSGAGIVIDSVPLNEWRETEQKADALLLALEISKSNVKMAIDNVK